VLTSATGLVTVEDCGAFHETVLPDCAGSWVSLDPCLRLSMFALLLAGLVTDTMGVFSLELAEEALTKALEETAFVLVLPSAAPKDEEEY